MVGTVLVTGTSSGIGEATALGFLKAGWRVVATARDPAAAVRGASDARLLRLRLDVVDPSSIETAFAEAGERFGGVDVVVNNAGVGLAGPLEAVGLAQFREHLEVNLIGTAAVCRAAIPRMRARGRGLLINVTSLTGRVGVPFLSPYCASKFAVEGMTEALRYELKPFGVRVKLIEPGGVRTNFSLPWATHPAYEPTVSAVRELMARGGERSALPGEVAKVIVAAANDPSDRLRYTATDAGALLRLWRLLPDRIWRAFIARVFGTGSAQKPEPATRGQA